MYRLSAILQTRTGQPLNGDFAEGLFPPQERLPQERSGEPGEDLASTRSA